MSKPITWKDVPGVFGIEVGLVNNEWIDIQSGKPVPAELVAAIKEMFPEYQGNEITFEVQIDFRMSGYYAEQTWDSPAEGENVPTLDSVTVNPPNIAKPGYDKGKAKTLPQALAKTLFGFYEDKIQEAANETDCRWSD